MGGWTIVLKDQGHPVVPFLKTHLTHVKLQVPRWRPYIVLDPISMRARGCGPSEGLLRTPRAGTQKEIVLKDQRQTAFPSL